LDGASKEDDDKDETEDDDMFNDDGNAVETAVQQADCGPGKLPAEKMKDKAETEAVDVSSVVNSDDSKHEDADANSLS
jgi:hypothetical protein